MLKTILIILGVFILLLNALIVYSACVMASREDRVMERCYEKWEQEHTGQSFLSETED